MQIILIICKDVALSVFPGLPDRSIQETISWLQSIQISGDYYMSLRRLLRLLNEKAQSLP